MPEQRFPSELIAAQQAYEASELAINRAHGGDGSDLDELRQVMLARLADAIRLREQHGVITREDIRALRKAAAGAPQPGDDHAP